MSFIPLLKKIVTRTVRGSLLTLAFAKLELPSRIFWIVDFVNLNVNFPNCVFFAFALYVNWKVP